MPDNRETGLAAAARERMVEELRGTNKYAARFELTLSEMHIQELAHARAEALTDHGRVELDGSALRMIAEGFCDSPFLLQEDYAATLAELTDAFYYFKNACGDRIADDELIQVMRERYDAYDGSVDAVIGTTIESLCRARRIGEDLDEEREEEDAFDDA